MKKNNYENLIIAFGSVIAINMVLPLLDSLTSMAMSAINKTVNKWQLDMQLDQAEAQAASEVIAPASSVTHAIGFTIPTEEEYEYDDE